MSHFTLPKEGGLISNHLPKDILHSRERIPTEIYADAFSASEEIAGIIIESINKVPKGVTYKLGLTTGDTPTLLYKMLVEKYNAGEVSFKNVEIFTIDEYYPFPKDAPQSRNNIIYNELLGHIDVLPENVHTPDGTVPQEKVFDYCLEFGEKAKELDLLVIGIGEHGQVGFNEAGSSWRSRTRVVQLSYQSRKRQVHNFNGDMDATPKSAITLGLNSMMCAKRVILMAWGETKTEVVTKIVEEKVDPSYPASYFQRHENASIYVDEVAAEKIVRIDSPWLVGPCEWTPKLRRKAVVWLCQRTHKSMLKLTHQDYLENSLEELVEKFGPYDKINIEVFNDLQHTISGWPGGKPNADDSTRPVKSSPYPKTVVIFSPHPDDDVISMGGTFIRLVHQGHNVHVAYETSGDVAVHDDVVIQHYDAASELGFEDRQKHVRELIAQKRPGVAEPRELLDIKAAIRRSEARGADRSFGLQDDHIHFLNLPFYESGGIKKLPCTQVDIDIIKSFLKEIKPDQIYMAGDLADPHGTHRVCTEAALDAIEQLRKEGETWLGNTNIWLYRGAWMEWELGRVDMAVPLSPSEVVEKRHAIFHHLSQKDIVPFPGEDPREFWQRAEERTQNTANLYNELGMAEYQAIEVFLKLC